MHPAYGTMTRPQLARLALALLVAALAFVATTRIGPAFARSLSAHPGSPDPPPFLPDDAAGGRPGDWARYQWNFAGRYGVDAPHAWANLIAAGAPGGAGVTVAVLDTGVAYTNRKSFRRSPDLAASQFVPGWDFVDDDAYPLDKNGHGTHVASTIAEQTGNGYGLTGLAYGARIMPVRVLDGYGDGDAIKIARGVIFAVDHGAKVINLSLNFDRRISAGQIPQLLRALRYAREHGTLVVTAAGNDHAEGLPYPARSEDVLSVGATTEFGCTATYSSFGRDLDVVAPGGGTDADAPGRPELRQPPHRPFDLPDHASATAPRPSAGAASSAPRWRRRTSRRSRHSSSRAGSSATTRHRPS